MMDLDVGVVSEVEKKQKKKLLLDYLYDNLKNHNWWAYRYFFCELLALLNVIGKYIIKRRTNKIFNMKLTISKFFFINDKTIFKLLPIRSDGGNEDDKSLKKPFSM